MKAKNVLYHRLWSKNGSNWQNKPKTATEISIDLLCSKADMCHCIEDYIYTLCEGMIELLNNDFNLEVVRKHTILKQKIEHLGLDILAKSRAGSELFYLALFVDFKLSQNWLDKTLYKVIRNMFSQVMNLGLSFSKSLKKKILAMYREYLPVHPQRQYLISFFNSYLKSV